MDRQEAIRYLERKGIIAGQTKYNKEEEKEISAVMRGGKLYGDPLAEID